MTGVVVWLTGLPSSGKSTLAGVVVERLRAAGRSPALLDGDDVRAALVPAPGYDDVARAGFYATLANLAALLSRQGLIVVVAATAHRRAFRDRARRLAPAMIEVFVDTPLDECRRRDAKGLYAAGTTGLPGGQATDYEPPLHADLVVRPDTVDPAATIARLVRDSVERRG
jgi:adenylylsulfate kinase